MVGLGLTGGRAALPLKGKPGAPEVWGCDRRKDTARMAKEAGAIARACTETGIASCDVVVVCVPVIRSIGLIRRLGKRMRPGAGLSDGGSAKAGDAGGPGAADGPGNPRPRLRLRFPPPPRCRLYPRPFRGDPRFPGPSRVLRGGVPRLHEDRLEQPRAVERHRPPGTHRDPPSDTP